MEANLCLISRLCWDILHQTSITLIYLDIPHYGELLSIINLIYPNLQLGINCRVLWPSSSNRFSDIYDYFSYAQFLNVNANKNIIVYVNDCDKYVPGTRTYLKKLDAREVRLEKLRNRNKYDIKLPEDDYVSQVEEEEDENELEPSMETILLYALRKVPKIKCYVQDTILHNLLLANVKKGWPKERKLLEIAPDQMFEKSAPKKAKPEKKEKKEKAPKEGKKKK